MSGELDAMFGSMLINKVPSLWEKVRGGRPDALLALRACDCMAGQSEMMWAQVLAIC